MTVETALYPPQLNTARPTSSDFVSEGDDHLRLVKTVIKTTFPNFGGAFNATHTEANYLVGVTSPIQAQFTAKANTDSPVFTTAATLPAATTIGTVTAAEILRLAGVTSPIQTQINAKGAITGQTWTGAHSFGESVTVPTLAPGSTGTGAVNADYANSLAFAAALPAQSGNAGKLLTTSGSAASWSSTLNGPLVVQREVDGSAGIEISNTDSLGLNAAAALLLRAGAAAQGYVQMHRLLGQMQIGTFTNSPINILTNGSSALVIGTDQSVLAAGPLGYSPGSGGTVTQPTSKSTAVTLNKPSGVITTNNSLLAPGATVFFTLSNTCIKPNGLLVLGLTGAAGDYRLGHEIGPGGGAALIFITNTSTVNRTDVLGINFAVLTVATS